MMSADAQQLLQNFSAKVDMILQETMYEAKEKKGFTVLEETVSKSLEQVMEIREALLMRIKDIRKEEVEVCKDQNIKQEQMLSTMRMEVMAILLKLVDKDAATIEKLKEISEDLLRFRMSVNNEVMRLLMLPTTHGVVGVSFILTKFYLKNQFVFLAKFLY